MIDIIGINPSKTLYHIAWAGSPTTVTWEDPGGLLDCAQLALGFHEDHLAAVHRVLRDDARGYKFIEEVGPGFDEEQWSDTKESLAAQAALVERLYELAVTLVTLTDALQLWHALREGLVAMRALARDTNPITGPDFLNGLWYLLHPEEPVTVKDFAEFAMRLGTRPGLTIAEPRQFLRLSQGLPPIGILGQGIAGNMFLLPCVAVTGPIEDWGLLRKWPEVVDDPADGPKCWTWDVVDPSREWTKRETPAYAMEVLASWFTQERQCHPAACPTRRAEPPNVPDAWFGGTHASNGVRVAMLMAAHHHERELRDPSLVPRWEEAARSFIVLTLLFVSTEDGPVGRVIALLKDMLFFPPKVRCA